MRNIVLKYCNLMVRQPLLYVTVVGWFQLTRADIAKFLFLLKLCVTNCVLKCGQTEGPTDPSDGCTSPLQIFVLRSDQTISGRARARSSVCRNHPCVTNARESERERESLVFARMHCRASPKLTHNLSPSPSLSTPLTAQLRYNLSRWPVKRDNSAIYSTSRYKIDEVRRWKGQTNESNRKHVK